MDITLVALQGGLAYLFNTGCLPLSYSGKPGVNGVSDRGGVVWHREPVGVPRGYKTDISQSETDISQSDTDISQTLHAKVDQLDYMITDLSDST